MKASILILSLFLVGCGKELPAAWEVSQECESSILSTHGQTREIYNATWCHYFNGPCKVYNYAPVKTIEVDNTCTIHVIGG